MDARTSAIFLFSTGNSLFGQISSKNIKIFSLSWNLGPLLIRICRMEGCCSLFRLYTENTLFGQIWSKNSLSWNLVPRLIRIWRIHWWCVHFFCFGMGTYFLGKFSPQNHNCQFKLKFVTWTNSNIVSSIMLFICFTLEIPFLGKFGLKNQTC